MLKSNIKVSEWKLEDQLKTPEDVINYLKVSIEEDTTEEFLQSIADVVKSKGYVEIAKKMGVSREGLYKSFSGKSKPRYETIAKTLDVLGFRFDIVPKVKINL